MKIAVLGYSGAGKSTLARRLGARYGCPVLHLDQVQFLPGWRERDRAEALSIVSDFMARDSWIIDGNYAGFLLDRRLSEAEQIVLLDLNRWRCFFRALRRYARFRNQVREDMADGCAEKMDWEFVRWLLWEGRAPKRRARFRQLTAQYAEKTVRLKNQRQLDRYWEGLSC